MLTFFVSLTHYSIFSSLDSNVLFHHIYENFFFQTNIQIHMTLNIFSNCYNGQSYKLWHERTTNNNHIQREGI